MIERELFAGIDESDHIISRSFRLDGYSLCIDYYESLQDNKDKTLVVLVKDDKGSATFEGSIEDFMQLLRGAKGT